MPDPLFANDAYKTMLIPIGALADRRLIAVEMLYRARPDSGPAQIVFDFALRSRLNALDPQTDAVLLSIDNQATRDSVQPILSEFPSLPIATQIVNPPRWSASAGSTPSQCEWPIPNRWERYQYSDRWARLDSVFALADQCNPRGWFIFPAQDAIWGKSLIPRLIAFSQRNIQNGYSATVSPLSFYRHSAVQGASIPPDLIDLVNVIFNRDPFFAYRLRNNQMQGFWGKTGLIPIAMCGAIRQSVDRTFLEDDSEIDRAIRAKGGLTRAIWIRDPKVYRQALPVFTEADVRRVIARTLHYSLPAGNSFLLTKAERWLQMVIALNPRYRRQWARAQQLIAEENDQIQARVAHYGVSWFDWGSYRYVVRVGDPETEVWQLDR